MIKIYSYLFELIYSLVGDNDDDVLTTRRDVKILQHKLEEQTKIILDLQNEVSNLRKLHEMSGIGDSTSIDEFINVNIFIYFIILNLKNIN